MDSMSWTRKFQDLFSPSLLLQRSNMPGTRLVALVRYQFLCKPFHNWRKGVAQPVERWFLIRAAQEGF